MRKREQIEEDIKTTSSVALTLEVLLDIRDLLMELRKVRTETK